MANYSTRAIFGSLVSYELTLGYRPLTVGEPVRHKGAAFVTDMLGGIPAVKLPSAVTSAGNCVCDLMYWVVGTNKVIRLEGAFREPKIEEGVSEWVYTCSEKPELRDRIKAVKKFLEENAPSLLPANGMELRRILKSWPRDARVAILYCGWGPCGFSYGLPSDRLVAEALAAYAEPQRGLKRPLVLSGSYFDEDEEEWVGWRSTYEIPVD